MAHLKKQMYSPYTYSLASTVRSQLASPRLVTYADETM